MLDENSLVRLDERLLIYETKYKEHHFIASLKFFLHLLSIFCGRRMKNPVAAQESDLSANMLRNDRIHIAMISSGGLGDHVNFANWVYCFRKKFYSEPIYIDVVFKDKYALASFLFKEGTLCGRIFDKQRFETERERYDLVIDASGFPKIERYSKSKIASLSPNLARYVERCEEYKTFSRAAFRGYAYGLQQLCILEGRKHINRSDVYSMLGMGEEYEYPLFIDCNEDEYLKSLGLSSKNFITIQTGFDSLYDSHVKAWPIEHWNSLVSMIVSYFPTLLVVQVGNSGELVAHKSVKRLVGRTTLDEAKVLMKHSLVHIDVEGGLVHLRHALHGGASLVLFGPTAIDFFNYAENTGLKSSVCPHTCYQMTSCWPSTCPLYGKNRCMQELMPETVFAEFTKMYQGDEKCSK